jgi:hypothetical protein
MGDDDLKQVPKFKYLGSIFTEDGKNKEDKIKQINFLPSLTLQSTLDLNVPCRPKHSKALLVSYAFKCPSKKTQSFCPCSRALNRSGKGLNKLKLCLIIKSNYFFQIILDWK